jgi:hypothetical protein
MVSTLPPSLNGPLAFISATGTFPGSLRPDIRIESPGTMRFAERVTTQRSTQCRSLPFSGMFHEYHWPTTSGSGLPIGPSTDVNQAHLPRFPINSMRVISSVRVISPAILFLDPSKYLFFGSQISARPPVKPMRFKAPRFQRDTAGQDHCIGPRCYSAA